MTIKACNPTELQWYYDSSRCGVTILWIARTSYKYNEKGRLDCCRTYNSSNFTKFPSSDGREPENLFVERDLQN